MLQSAKSELSDLQVEQQREMEGLLEVSWSSFLIPECVTDLDLQSEMIIFGLLLTTFEGSWCINGK